MTVQSIEDKLCQEVAVITSKDAGLIDATATLSTLGLDSLGLVEVFVAIERHYGLKLLEIGLDNEDLESIQTISKKVNELLTNEQ